MTGYALAGAIAEQKPSDVRRAASRAPGSPSDLRVALAPHAGRARHAGDRSPTQKGSERDEDVEGDRRRPRPEQCRARGRDRLVYGDEARTEFLDGDLKRRDQHRLLSSTTRPHSQRRTSAGQQIAVDNAERLRRRLSTLLAGADRTARSSAVRISISEHVMQLKGQIDASPQATARRRTRWRARRTDHMCMTGDTLAAAIVKQSRRTSPRASRARVCCYVSVYSGPEPPSGGVRRPPLAVIAPHWTQFDGVTSHAHRAVAVALPDLVDLRRAHALPQLGRARAARARGRGCGSAGRRACGCPTRRPTRACRT